MEARNRVGIELSYLPAQATQAGGISSLEWILRILKSLKIRALYSVQTLYIFKTYRLMAYFYQ
jgi:hypothetical protein